MSETQIEWCSTTWNPVTGCTPISEGCQHCYARRMAKRLVGRYGYPADDPFRVTLRGDRLDQPLHWKKPRRALVCSMADLFHKDVPRDYIEDVFSIIKQCPRHRFLLLTKRADRMRRIINELNNWQQPTVATNVWCGVTAENQIRADERLPELVRVIAKVRFVCCEPLLGPVDIRRYVGRKWHGIDWVIAGEETGPGARPAKLEWVRDLRDQCQEFGVPFFWKRWWRGGGREIDGRLWEQYPEGT